MRRASAAADNPRVTPVPVLTPAADRAPAHDAAPPAPPPDRVRRAIVVADLVESVRLLQSHEADVIDRWRRYVAGVRADLLPVHGGRMVKSLGDGMLLEFSRCGDAVAAALALHRAIVPYNAGADPASAMALRVGVHVAEVVLDEFDVFGAGVNTAARIAGLAGPGETRLSAEVRDEIADGLDAELHDHGECWVKHIDQPLRVFEARPPGAAAPAEAVLPMLGPLGIAVAVMPFVARGGGDDGPVLADLLADQVSGSLSRSSHLRVISRWSAQTVARRDVDVAEAGRLLGAEYLVTGTAYALGSRVQLTAELLDVRAQAVLWSTTLRAALDDVLAGADAIVPELVGGVSQHIVERELERSAHAPLPSLDSHRLLMSAVSLIHRSAPRDFARAESLLEALAERHRRLPYAHAWLAHWHAMSIVQGLSADLHAARAQAFEHARRALDADADSALALTMMGLVRGFVMADLDEADRHYARALALNPNEALAWLYTGTLRAWQGRGPEGYVAAQKALSLAPHDPLRYYYDSLAGFAALAAGEHEAAAALSQRSLRAHARHTSTHRTLAIAQWKLGQQDAARATVRDMLRLEPDFSAARYLQRFPGGITPMAVDNAETLVAAGAARG